MHVASNRSKRSAFTLVELLVVIGIIALLISMLLPALQQARRQANTVKCLAQLQQFGSVFNIYSVENNGWWPMALHAYNASGNSDVPPGAQRNRTKRWHDFIGKYLNNGKPVNWDGTGASNASQDQLSDLKARGNSIFWGCPAWGENQRSYIVRAYPTISINTTASTLHVGYAMNNAPMAPAPGKIVGNTGGSAPNARSNTIYRAGTGTLTSTSTWGWYLKQSQWKRPGERLLMADNIHRDMSVGFGNPWWHAFSGWAGKPMPKVPDIFSFTLDFNRHGKFTIGNGYNDKSMNVLFCDGHAATVSCKEAHNAVRFHLH